MPKTPPPSKLGGGVSGFCFSCQGFVATRRADRLMEKEGGFSLLRNYIKDFAVGLQAR